MMTTLQVILNQASNILTACTTFGFCEPRLYPSQEEDLCISVQSSPRLIHTKLTQLDSRVRMNMLAFYLTEYLQCQVVVYSRAALSTEEGELLGAGVDLTATIATVQSVFGVDRASDYIFCKEEVTSKNRMYEKRRQEKLNEIKELGLPMTIEENKLMDTTALAEPDRREAKRLRETDNLTPHHLYSARIYPSDPSSSQHIAKKLCTFIDSDPILLEGLKRDPDIILDILKNKYGPTYTSQTSRGPG